MASTDGDARLNTLTERDVDPAKTVSEDPLRPTESTVRSIEADTQSSKTTQPGANKEQATRKHGKKTHRKVKASKTPSYTPCEDSSSDDEGGKRKSRVKTGSNDTDSSSDEDDAENRKSHKSKKKVKKVKKRRPADKSPSARRSPKEASDSDSSSSSSSSDSDDDSGTRKDAPQTTLDVSTQQNGLLEQQVQSLQFQLLQIQQTLGRPATMPFLNGYGYGQVPSFAPGMMPPSMPASFMPGQPPPPPPPTQSKPTTPADNGGIIISPRSKALLASRGSRRVPDRLADSSASEAEGGDGKKQSKKKSKSGARLDFKRVDWVWDDTLYTYKLQKTAATTTDSKFEDYIFHVRRTFDCDGRYRSTVIDIKSKLLRECLQEVIGEVRGVSLVDETPKVDPNLLFLYLEEFRTHKSHLKQVEPAGKTKKERKKDQERNKEKRLHLKVLVGYLDKDYHKVKESLYPMLENGLITFDLLWALWKPKTLTYMSTYGSHEDPRVFKVEQAEKQSSIMKGAFYWIDGKYFEFDGKKFGYGTLGEEIAEFQGARKITSLPCYPLKYHKNEAELREKLIERGKKFVSLSGVHYKSYVGMAYMKRKRMTIKFNIQQSRIMVDSVIFRRINPNYQVSIIRPTDHDILSDEEYSDDSDQYSSDDSRVNDGSPKFVTKVFKAPDGTVHTAKIPEDALKKQDSNEKLDTKPDDKNDDEAKSTNEPEYDFTEEDYLTASPVVLGFAFSDKQWLELAVSNIQEIQWNEDAWGSLVLEPSTKDLIKALVESRKFKAAERIDDVIQGKGKGLVTVLHGPPGTGKTLTAEGISELLKCPLYMASAGELSTDSRFLETELQKILDICHAWGAILLLDEADVFLEKRNMADIHRNALVSIFLRQLEYFQGILFLTTNRVETFDEAFQSRIHVALRYDALDSRAKKAIFQMFIERVRTLGKMELDEFRDEDLEALARKDLNGREIKNVVGSAQDLAANKGEPLGMKHIRLVLDVHAKFGRDLKGGTGYEDAMRSYF